MKHKTVHVAVEGVFDGIAVHRAGWNAAVMLGQGAKEPVVEWACRIPAKHWIFIMLDGDAKTHANQLLHTIKPVHKRIIIITLPDHLDPGGLLPETLDHLLVQWEERILPFGENHASTR